MSYSLCLGSLSSRTFTYRMPPNTVEAGFSDAELVYDVTHGSNRSNTRHARFSACTDDSRCVRKTVGVRQSDGFLLFNVTSLLQQVVSSYGMPDDKSTVSFTIHRFAHYRYLNSTPLAVIHNVPKAMYLNENARRVTNLRPRRSLFSRFASVSVITDAERCSLVHWTLHFKDIGWDDWVVQPADYQANACRGLCSIHDLDDNDVIQVNMSGHAFLREMFRERTNDSQLLTTVTKPLCVPVTMLPLNLLLNNEDGVLYVKRMSEMIADSCGCY